MGEEVPFPVAEEPWTREQAEALLRAVEELFHKVDIDGLVNGFTPDCVFRFGEMPEQTGREAVRALFEARMARQQDYRLSKTLLALDGNRLANSWEGTWTDRESGKKMAGFGVEVWVMRDGMIARWDASFSVWEQGGPRRPAVT